MQHRDLYPDQYSHPLCGRVARVVIDGEHRLSGTVERVVYSRFGPLAIFHGHETAYRVADCQEGER